MKIGVPVVLLLNNGKGWTSAAKVREWKPFVQGLGPAKAIVEANPDLVKWAHAEGMTVIPYTFRSSNSGRHPERTRRDGAVSLHLGVDGLFTDNPDQFPEVIRQFSVSPVQRPIDCSELPLN